MRHFVKIQEVQPTEPCLHGEMNKIYVQNIIFHASAAVYIVKWHEGKVSTMGS